METYNIPALVKKILLSRGYKTEKSMVNFLYNSISSLSEPFFIPDLKKACEVLKEAILKKEKIFVYGDGDTDGICASFLLLNLLKVVNANFSFRLTHRLDEDYEIEDALIDELAEEEYSLLISVDCGISSYSALKKAREYGIKVIILDHHIGEPSKLQTFHIYVNPWLKKKWPEGTENLSGTGIVYKFIEGMGILLPGIKEAMAHNFVEVVALSIIADSLPLTGENRIFVKEGLHRMPFTKIKGLGYLIETQNIRQPLHPRDISMRIVSLLNSPGRLGKPDVALNLLMENDDHSIKKIIEEIAKIDRERYQMVAKAMGKIKKEELENGIVISEKISPGICGIIASRLAGNYCKPFMVGYLSSNFLKGSIRAPENYNLYENLKPIKKYMVSLGGHKEAMGFKCPVTHIPKIKSFWKGIKWKTGNKKQYYDCPLDIRDINPSIIEEVTNYLQPFGKGNPEPVFLCRNVSFTKISARNNGNNGPFWVKKDGAIYEAVFSSEHSFMPDKEKVDILYTPSVRRQNNLYRIVLKVKKIL
ncbi:MAG TPA: DHH family phosphoesterase [bacterium]|nr:DHH family phosphoesterase [bacterium]